MSFKKWNKKSITFPHLNFLALILGSLIATHSAFASVDLYGGLMIGSASFSENSGANTFNHTNSFFVGHFGFGGGARVKYDFANFSLGAIGELGWTGDSFDRKQVGVVNDVTYRDESYRTIAGISSAIKVANLSLIAEYYPWLQNTITYSDEKAENPFRKNDKLGGTGFGLGLNFGLIGGLSYTTMFRRLTYKDVQMNGTSVSLPNSQYTTLNFDDILVGSTLSF